ncbi:MAG: peptidylprolyl isomerase [Bacteroidales bacterium]|nr:peptidylprolyl isomerase [Bacteroidales bacterium]
MKKLFLILLLSAGMFSIQAQNDNRVLVTIGDEAVTAGEFLKTYSKNNNLSKATEADLREYLNLFINFKMKVKEGEILQLDTAKKFKMELAQYQRQSSQQFLVDKEVTKELEDEVLERALIDLRASHILVNCGENDAPKDTLAAYQKALSIRNEILSGKLTFAEAAVEYSDDPSARDIINPQTNRLHPGNKGDLGYFSVFDLIYPFECGAYNTPVGQISMPVRTRFGYHLIYVQDRIPAIEQIEIAQIYVSDSTAKEGKQIPETAQRLKEIQNALQQGMTFEDAAKHFSEDKDVQETGGVQEPFAPNRRQGDFVRAILNLKPGEVSQPIPSQNGWHIVKLLEATPVVLDDDNRYNLISRISRDTRSHKSKDSFIAKLKKEYNYEESGRAKAIKFFLKNMPEEFFQSKDADLTKIKGIEKLKPMASFADVTISATDFAKLINRFKGSQIHNNEYAGFFQERFDVLVQDKIMRYENSRLLDKYPELNELVQEFHDGMVLYEINTLKVWAEAVHDSTGLKAFYDENINRYIDPQTNTPQTLESIRAIVITDYQEYLDNQWVMELRKKYKPSIDENVFSTLIKK